MEQVLNMAASNLVSPIILSFVLGVFAALARSDLSIPEAVAKGMSIYLLFAIGFKGGVGVSEYGADGTLLLTLLAGVILSFAAMPSTPWAKNLLRQGRTWISRRGPG